MPGSLRRARIACTVAYAVALIAAGVTLEMVPTWTWARLPLLGAAFWGAVAADLVGTVVVFGFSRAFDNSSFYDPYWSVAPIAMGALWLYTGPSEPSVRAWVSLGLCTVWGVRLTFNWGRRWRGFGDEDWRYDDFRHSTGRAYWLVSFAGIHLFPTLMVLLACAPLYVAVTSPRTSGALDLLATAITAGAIGIESLADRQLHDFLVRRRSDDELLDQGLWRYSRHPNYFGEVAFWWGIGLFGVAAAPGAWWLLSGAAAMTIMFFTVSIPLIERRALKRRPHYAEQIAKVSALIPWPRREA